MLNPSSSEWCEQRGPVCIYTWERLSVLGVRSPRERVLAGTKSVSSPPLCQVDGGVPVSDRPVLSLARRYGHLNASPKTYQY